MKKKVIRILSLLLCSMMLLQDISPVCAYATEEVAGTENKSVENQKPPDAGENARAKTYNNVYYTTKKTIVLKHAFNSKFYIRVLKDYENTNVFFKSGNGGYLEKGTDVQISNTKWHKVHSDKLTITRSGNDQIITMDCDTFKVTPYLQVEKYARPGYTLKGEPKITGTSNENTTKSSNASTITTHASTHEIIRKDGYMDIYLGALSDVSEITFDWEANNYKVRYNANGGTGTMSDSLHTYDTPKVLNANKFTRTGYKFAGWNTKKDGSGTAYKDKTSVENLTPIADDIVTLYAQWEPVSVKVVFHKNDGSDTTYTETYTYGKSGNKFGMKLASTGSGIGSKSFGNWTPRKGNELLGWSASKTATAKEYTTDSSVTNNWINANSGKTIDLYAVWDPNQYTVNYNGNGHTSGSTDATTHYYGKPSPLALNGFVKDGFHFDTWTGKANGGSEYEAGQKVSDLTDVDGGKVTLFAGWLPNKLTIHYYANGGRITDSTKGYSIKDGYLMAKGDSSNKAYKAFLYNNDDDLVNVHNMNGTFGVTNPGYHLEDGKEYQINSKTGKEIDHDAEALSTFQNYFKDDDNTITLYANWMANTYTVKYDLNGGSGTVSPSKHTYGTAKPLNRCTGAKKGHTFAGWKYVKDGKTYIYTDEQSVKNLTEVHKDTVTLVAQWKAVEIPQKTNKLTIYYHANGGTVTDTSKGHTLSSDGYALLEDKSGKAYKVIKYNDDENPVNVHNIFGSFGVSKKGYHSKEGKQYRINDPKNGKEINNDSEPLSTFWPYFEDADNTITLYSNWVANTYTVKYNGNGNTSGSTASSEHTYDESKNLTANDFVKTGYTFAGWNTEADGSGTSYANKASVKNLTAAKGGSVTLYAQWKANTYTVTYDGNGSTSGETAASSHTYDTAKALTANGFVKSGYTFAGWNTAADGSGTSYANKASVKNLTAEKDGTAVLYAQWTKNAYTVTYGGNGHTSGSTAASSHTYDTAKALTANGFKRVGYTFAGWNTQADGKGIRYADKASVKNLTTANKGNVTLYAQWTANTYTVNYDGNGNTGGSTTASSHTYDSAQTLTTNGFVREGYTFVGWNTQADGCGTAYADLASVNNLTATDKGTVTLYAQWRANSYTITFDGNGATSGSMTDMTCFYDTSYTLNENAFIRTGYTFIGWEAVTGNGPAEFYDMQTIVNLTAEDGATIMLHARWEGYRMETVFNRNASEDDTEYTTEEFFYDRTLQMFPQANAFWEKTGFHIIGWAEEKDALTTDYDYMYEVDNSYIETHYPKHTLYAVWTENTYTVHYDGNGHTSGLTVESYHTYNRQQPLTENGYSRTGYTFTGWNTEADGSGDSYADMEKVLNLTAEDGETVILYAQWDKHPEIKAKDRYFSLEEAKNGAITAEELYATVTAADFEDGVLVNGTDVLLKDFDPSVFTSLTGNAKIEITYEAEDSFGTVVSTTVTVSVVVIETTESPTETYVRFISEDFYADEEGNLLSQAEGGLEETSIWRTDESYKKTLDKVLHAKKINVETKTIKAFGKEWEVEVEGSGEWVDAEEIWILKKEDLSAMKKYTSEHGHVLNALDEFFALFGNCKKASNQVRVGCLLILLY